MTEHDYSNTFDSFIDAAWLQDSLETDDSMLALLPSFSSHKEEEPLGYYMCTSNAELKDHFPTTTSGISFLVPSSNSHQHIRSTSGVDIHQARGSCVVPAALEANNSQMIINPGNGRKREGSSDRTESENEASSTGVLSTKPTTHQAKHFPLDEDAQLSALLEDKTISAKERRQIRNKISARNFRLRRKEYINRLEAQVKQQEAEAKKAKEKASRLQTENEALREELLSLKQKHDLLLTDHQKLLSECKSAGGLMSSGEHTTCKDASINVKTSQRRLWPSNASNRDVIVRMVLVSETFNVAADTIVNSKKPTSKNSENDFETLFLQYLGSSEGSQSPL